MAGTGLALGGRASALPFVTPKPAKKPSKLIVGTYADPYKHALHVAAGIPFTKETGIPVVYDTTLVLGEGFAKIQQAIKAGRRPPVDLSYNALPFAYKASVQGLSTPLDPTLVTNLTHLNPVARPPASLPFDKGWPYVEFNYISFAFVYRTDRLKPSDIDSWYKIFAPSFKGKLGIFAFYNNTIFMIAKLLKIDPEKDDMTPVFAKLHTLKPKIRAIGFDEDAVKALTTGTVDMWIALPGDGIAARSAGAPIKWLIPKEGSTVDGDSLFVSSHIPPETAYYAQVYINHALSATGQAKFAGLAGAIPVNKSAKLPTYMRGDLAFPFTAAQLKHFVKAPTEAMARHDTDWQRAFINAIKG